ncbi:MAG: hypothetical protein ACOX7U_00010 [Desulfitobacteriia bacterium]
MDKFLRSFLAGVLGGIAMNIWSVIVYYILKISKMRFLDWMAIVLYGHMPHTNLEAIYALPIQIGFCGGLGVVMFYFFKAFGYKHFLIKSMIFGLGISVILYAILALFHAPGMFVLALPTVFSNHIGALIWGVITGFYLRAIKSEFT